MSAYTLENSRPEQARLGAQASILRAHDRALLDGVELKPGSSAVDLGCGPGGSLDLLSETVGPTGRVLGVEIDAGNVSAARALVDRQRLSNVQIANGDARRTGLPSSSVDLAHTRLLLVNISGPEQVVAEMARIVRPGGWIAVMEPDVALRVCHPPHPGVERLTELLAAAYRRDGADRYLGRRLPHLFATAGLVEIVAEAHADVCPPGHPQRSVIPDLVRNMRAKILAQGLVGERELDHLDREAREHLGDSGTLILPVTYFLAWARKPASAT